MISRLVLPVILQLMGVAVILAEFVLPSAGILTIAALGLFGYSLFLVFSTVSLTAGFTFLVIDIFLIPVLLILGVKILAASPATLKSSLKSKEGGSVQPLSLIELKGAEGIALTDLRPAGTAMLNGKKYDVISKGVYIDKNSRITVSAVDSNRIVVKKI